jgi:hypothetical protein
MSQLLIVAKGDVNILPGITTAGQAPVEIGGGNAPLDPPYGCP